MSGIQRAISAARKMFRRNVRRPFCTSLVVCAATFLSSTVAAQAVEVDPGLYQRGLSVYLDNCTACHGATGLGDGPEAEKQLSRPRNLQIGNFKYRSTGPAEYVAREDLVRIITNGIRGPFGQNMPGFRTLPPRDIDAVIEVLRVMADISEFAQPVPVPPRPAQIERGLGARLFSDMGCKDCHGQYGDGLGMLATSLTDADGRAILPADMTSGEFKGGKRPEDIWMRIYSGVDGTPMPSFGTGLSPTEIWALVDYVRAFSR